MPAKTGKTGYTFKIVSNTLPTLPADIKAIVVDEVKRGTLAVEAGAKAKAPVRTGTLRRSIHSVFENGGLKGICGPSVDYGIYPEFGTRHMAARPYMRPAAENALPDTVQRIKAALGKVR